MGHGGSATYRRLKRRFLSLTAESSGGRLLPPNKPAEVPPLKCAPPLARSAAHPSPPPSSARPLCRPHRPLLWAAPRAPAFGRPARLAGGPQPAAVRRRSPGPGAPALGRTPGRSARKKQGPACFVSGTL